MLAAGAVVYVKIAWWVGLIVMLIGLKSLVTWYIPERWATRIPLFVNATVVAIVGVLLTTDWLPMGAQRPFITNLLFVVLCVGGLLLLFKLFIRFYPRLLAYFLDNRSHFLLPLGVLVFMGLSVWLGFANILFFLPKKVFTHEPLATVSWLFPGLGKEFMPPLDEGSFLYMPTTMTHASIGEVHDVLRKQDVAITAIPEVENAVGKLGRVESPLDPAPISMIETIINIRPEYRVDAQGNRLRFKFNGKSGTFSRDATGNPIPDKHGKPYRQWRSEIKTPQDIWDVIVREAKIPGVTSALKLQPIAARLVMLQSGMRAPMGIKVRGPNLDAIEKVGMELERYLKEVPSVEAAAVYADRIVGKPYLEIEIDRDAIARYGVSIQKVQTVIEVALGGMGITTTVEGRERYAIRVRYPRSCVDWVVGLRILNGF